MFSIEKQLIALREILALSALLKEELIPAQRESIKIKLANYAFPENIKMNEEEEPDYQIALCGCQTRSNTDLSVGWHRCGRDE